ncbi:MAG: hypothetical protein R2753_10700 [Chitinophagales bacterium]
MSPLYSLDNAVGNKSFVTVDIATGAILSSIVIPGSSGFEYNLGGDVFDPINQIAYFLGSTMRCYGLMLHRETVEYQQ